MPGDQPDKGDKAVAQPPNGTGGAHEQPGHGEVQGARAAMAPREGVDHIVGAATIGGDGNGPKHTAAYTKAIDTMLERTRSALGLPEFSTLPEADKNRDRENLIRQMPDDLTAQSSSPFVHEFQKILANEHVRMERNPNAPMADRMDSAMALARLDPTNKEILDAQQQKWDAMTPEQKKAAIDQAMSIPPEQRKHARDEAQREGRYTGMLAISQNGLNDFAMAADPQKEISIRNAQTGETERLRSDARQQIGDSLEQQLYAPLKTEDSQKIAREVIDDVKKRLRGESRDGQPSPDSPGPAKYDTIASELEQDAARETNGQKKATMEAAARMLKRAGRELTAQESASDEAIRQSADGDLRRAGLGSRDTLGYESEMAGNIHQRIGTKMEDRFKAGHLAEDAKDPERLRRELGINERELEHLKGPDKIKLAEELKGRLVAFGIAADIAPGIARAVFRLAE